VDEMETLATEQHFMCTDVQWDPTGRYVATSVNSMQQMDTGYMMWSFNGRQLYKWVARRPGKGGAPCWRCLAPGLPVAACLSTPWEPAAAQPPPQTRGHAPPGATPPPSTPSALRPCTRAATPRTSSTSCCGGRACR
jgi:hypothetical protein